MLTFVVLLLSVVRLQVAIDGKAQLDSSVAGAGPQACVRRVQYVHETTSPNAILTTTLYIVKRCFTGVQQSPPGAAASGHNTKHTLTP